MAKEAVKGLTLKKRIGYFSSRKEIILGVRVGESVRVRKAVILSRAFSHSMVAEGTELRSLKPHLGAI